MLQNPRLGAPAFAYIHFSVDFEWPAGYQLKVIGRREGEEVFEEDVYRDLDVFELHELLVDVAAVMLGV